MKKLPLLIGGLVLFFTINCREIVNSVLDVLPPFDVPYSKSLDVPFAIVSATEFTRTPEIAMNIDLDAKIKEKKPNLSIKNLKSVKMNTLSLNYVSSKLGNKLELIKNAKIYLKAPNQEERLIATSFNNTDPNTIIFNVNDEEILEYFRTTENSLIFEIQASNKSTDVIKIKGISGFKIKIKL
ncbi:hypothetical protein [Kaistella sp.]|uniref:hypothetical protein n=1 Tax=Kaistella sp. TaxID=2782235 RepID=UPI003C468F6F